MMLPGVRYPLAPHLTSTTVKSENYPKQNAVDGLSGWVLFQRAFTDLLCGLGTPEKSEEPVRCLEDEVAQLEPAEEIEKEVEIIFESESEPVEEEEEEGQVEEVVLAKIEGRRQSAQKGVRRPLVRRMLRRLLLK